MRTSSLLTLAVLATALTVAGCRCTPPHTVDQAPDFVPDPKALSFQACPTKDESGNPVKDVFPDEQQLAVHNYGLVPGALQVSFTGADKDAFSVVADKVPESIDSTSEITFPVRFSPVKKGDSLATLVLDDGYDTTDPVSVTLVGTGTNLPSQPTLDVLLENQLHIACSKDTQCSSNQVCYQSECWDHCFAGGTCLQTFTDTFYKNATTMKVRVRNSGCPALKVTQMQMALPSGTTGNLAFFLDEPSVPPTTATPLVLTTADGNADQLLKVRFQPEDDGSGILQRVGVLTLATNDPAYPTFEIQFFGSAAEPSIYALPTYCDFTNPSDLCGNTTKVADQARFEIKNGGNAEIRVDSVTFGAGGAGGRFTIQQNVVMQTIPVGQSKTLLVQHHDAPLYVTDTLTVTASTTSNPSLPAGNAILTLAGGKKPCMTTDPADQLNFKNPATTLSYQQVKIMNGAGCGDLIVNNVFVDPQPFFSVFDPLIPAGTAVSAGTSVIATVQFKKPVSGGIQAGVLRIDTNDPDYGPPPFKVIPLYSESPLDQLPVAVLKGCTPADTTCASGQTGAMTVRLQDLPPGNKTLTMWGKDSYDPGNTGATPISAYTFRLVTKPTGATSTLANDGQKTATSTSTLTLDPTASGFYRITLLVYDDQNQPSPTAAELKLTIQP